MNAGLLDPEFLEKVEPSRVAAYLRKAGWTQKKSYSVNASIWTRWNAFRGTESEILLPSDREVGDYSLRLAEALVELADFEGRPLHEVVLSIKGRGLLRIGSIRDWRDNLIRLWGLDIFGLAGVEKMIIVELFSAAVLLTTLLIFDLGVWTLLFYMLVDGDLLLLAIALGVMFALGAAVHRRSLLIMSSGLRGTGRIVRVCASLILAGLSMIASFQPVALLVFQGAIDRYIFSESLEVPKNESEAGRFFYRVSILRQLVEEDSDEGHEYRRTYFAVFLLVGAMNMMPISFVVLSAGGLRKYYSSVSIESAKDANPEVESYAGAEQAPNPGPQADV